MPAALAALMGSPIARVFLGATMIASTFCEIKSFICLACFSASSPERTTTLYPCFSASALAASANSTKKGLAKVITVIPSCLVLLLVASLFSEAPFSPQLVKKPRQATSSKIFSSLFIYLSYWLIVFWLILLCFDRNKALGVSHGKMKIKSTR